MIKVAHIATSYNSAVTILATKLNALSQFDDLDVTVITGRRPPDADLPTPCVRHLCVPMVRAIRPWRDAVSIGRMRRLFRCEGFDVVHSHTAKAGVVSAAAARLARVPLVVHTYHGLPFYGDQSKRSFHSYRLIERTACRVRDHVFSQNRQDLSMCASLMGSSHKVSYEGNGVDAAFVRRSACEQIDRAMAEFRPNGLRIAMVSRLQPVKRVGDFLAALAILSSEGVDFSAVIAGPGPMGDALRAKALALGLTNRVKILGWIPYVHGLLSAADVVVLASEKEGIPRSLMEAMAMGKAVVATDVPGTKELVVDYVTGYLTPLGDVDALAGALKKLARDESTRHSFGQAGRTRVENDFNDLNIAADWARFYRERLAKTHRTNASTT